jgi:hypothetical protein
MNEDADCFVFSLLTNAHEAEFPGEDPAGALVSENLKFGKHSQSHNPTSRQGRHTFYDTISEFSALL